MLDDTYSIDLLIQKILDNDKQYDLDKIIHAYEFAAEAHEGQKRSSGQPYIIHPIAVSYILLELGMDSDTICAAMLHDVVEDTSVTLEELSRNFGEDVAELVDGVTKLNKFPMFTKEEQQAENVRKILLAMWKDIRVIIIKLCDRLHNMRTLRFRPIEKQRATALETLNIYAPLANRIGIRTVKDELEDLAFHYLDPYAYSDIEHILEIGKDAREEFINTIKDRVAKRLEQQSCFSNPPQIDGRVKSIYGIYKKIYVDHKDIDEIYDKYALRIIVNTVTECYNALGIIHDMFRPIPNRFKDYISTPKANMYQSLHTTVLGREGIPFEVQIRTWDMHYTAEYGIAAHWKYKEGIQGKDRLEERLSWLRQVLEAQKDADDVEEIVRAIKSDIAPEEVLVFTPKGGMISLPNGATIIDFAYKIHTQVGNRMTGAKTDGKMVSLDHKLKTGEIVEIITTKDPTHGPSRGWLDIAKTNEARSKIRSWFKKERRDENIIQGRTALEAEFRRNRIVIAESDLPTFLSDDLKRHNCQNIDDFYAAIGYGGVTLTKIIPRLKENYAKLCSENEIALISDGDNVVSAGNPDGIVVEGVDNCLIKLSQCCNPLPGDDIVGFITRGHGVSIHKQDCTNYLASLEDEENTERWIACRWANAVKSYYRTTLDVVASDRYGLLSDVCAALTEARVPIHHVTARELKNGNANIVATIGVGSKEQLSTLTEKLEKISGVISVDRTGK